MIFTYFHFAADKKLTEAISRAGRLHRLRDLRAAVSRAAAAHADVGIAGRMQFQEGASTWEALWRRGGLLGEYRSRARQVVILGRNRRINAARCRRTWRKGHVLDLSLERLRYLSDVMPANVTLIYSNRHNILEQISTADLVVGAVLIPGGRTAPYPP